MEKLEKTLQEVSVESSKLREKTPSYEGLKLIETQVYKDGTSVKYWM